MIRAVVLLLYNGVLVCLAREDHLYHKIRNGYVELILLLSALSAIVIPEVRCISRVAAMFMVSIPMLLMAYAVPGSFGGGDIKLVFACGAFLGTKLLLEGTLTAVFLAGGYCLWLICIKKVGKNVQFALGPFLSAGYLMVSLQLF